MRKPSTPRRIVSAGPLLLLLLGALLSAQACTAGEGATPTCTQDVTGDGNQNLDNGCNKFAACRADPLDENSQVLPATECCKDKNGNALEGGDLERCLYAYGEGEGSASGN